MMLYKFIGEDAIIPVLEKREIRITSLGRLNDIFDCLPRLIRGGHDLGVHADALRKGYGKAYGMICYSRHPASLLLWAHYAQMHRGAAIAFYFDTNLPRYEDGTALAVDYRYDNVRPILDLEDLKLRDGKILFLPESKKAIVDAYLVKGRDWFYEQEYRRFLDIRGISPREEGSGLSYYESFPEGSFRGVLLGLNCSLTPEQIWAIPGCKNVIVEKVKFAGDGAKSEIDFGFHINLRDVVLGNGSEEGSYES